MAEVSVEQVLMRGGAIWAIAMAAHLAASFVASRFRSGDAGGFLVVMVLTLSHALILLGASTSAAYATAWMIRNYANTLHYEIFFAICAAAGIAGIYLGALGGVLARNQGARLAGAEAEKFEFRPLFRFKPVELVARQRDTADNRSEVDRRYATANMLAWGLLVFVIGACLWHDAPSWFLLLVCATIGVSMAFSATFKPGVLSKEAIKSDANSGLFFLIGFAPLGLALRAMYRFELIDWRWPLLVAMVIGLPLTLIQMRQIGGFDRHKVGAIVLSAFLCYMGPGSLIWSSLQFANDVGTPDLVASYHVQISAKHEQRGKYDTMYWVNAVDVPDLNGIEKFKLKRLAYERLSVGGDACIQVWRGMLPLRWYEVVQCS